MTSLAYLFVTHLLVWKFIRSWFKVLIFVESLTLILIGCSMFWAVALWVPNSAERPNHELAASYLYGDTSFRTSQGWHGSGKIRGKDFTTGECGTTLYAPITGIVMYNGLDNYQHPIVNAVGEVVGYWPPASVLRIKGTGGEMILLHGNYTAKVGTAVRQGVTVVGTEASIGWSTGCHTHMAITYSPQSPVGGGYVSAYDKEPTDATIANRQRWGQIPGDLSKYDALVAVLECDDVGREGTLNTIVGKLDVLAFDCAGLEDGGRDWMIAGNYLVELDYYTRMQYPQLVGSWATLELD